MKQITRICTWSLPAMLFVAVLLFWLRLPEYMSYQEQYQLFLWDTDYFAERISVIGGFADYLGEFLVQFYYMPSVGAVILASIGMLLMILTALSAVSHAKSRNDWFKPCMMAISAIPALMWFKSLGDENMLLSYPCALILVLATSLLFGKLNTGNKPTFAVCLFVTFTLLYWLAGPLALILPVIAYLNMASAKPLARVYMMVLSLAASIGIIYIIHYLWFTQYPISELYYGINYYRISFIHPALLFWIPAVIVLICLLAKFIGHGVSSPISAAISTAAVAIFGIIYVPTGYNYQKMDILRYDYLVRTQQWNQIIKMAEQKPSTNPMALQAVNLALGKTGQLTQRMFQFPQQGIGGLLSHIQLDNTSCLITAETFYHLGMVNSAFRYNFDLQESIMNNRKSGRFMRRMASCMIINSQFGAAAKYVGMLKKSLFYRDWANKAESYIGNEEKIDQNPEWGEKRRLRYKSEMLYDYPEIEKMLGLLAIDSISNNKLAWDYFNAAAMLKCDLPMLTGMYHYAGDLFHETEIPRHIQEAIGMYWTFGHQNFDGLPYSISPEIKREITILAQAYTNNRNIPDAWQKQFTGTFYLYFLSRSPENENDEAKGIHRAD